MMRTPLKATKTKSSFIFILASLTLLSASVNSRAQMAKIPELSPAEADGIIQSWEVPSPFLDEYLISFMNTPNIGASLIKQIPSITVLRGMDLREKSSYMLLGPLVKHLPGGFDSRLAEALKSPKENGPALAQLADELSTAHGKAATEVAAVAQYLARGAIHGYETKTITPAALRKTAAMLEKMAFYGPSVSQNPRVQAAINAADTAWARQGEQKAKQMVDGFVYDPQDQNVGGGDQPTPVKLSKSRHSKTVTLHAHDDAASDNASRSAQGTQVVLWFSTEDLGQTTEEIADSIYGLIKRLDEDHHLKRNAVMKSKDNDSIAFKVTLPPGMTVDQLRAALADEPAFLKIESVH